MFLAICVGKGTIYSNGGGSFCVSESYTVEQNFLKNVNLYMLHVNMLI